jgi:uncharacterized protein YkwD
MIPEEEPVSFDVTPPHDDEPSSNQSTTTRRQQQQQHHDDKDNDTATKEGHELVNRTRIEHGVHTLKRSIHLDALAAEHAKAMAKRGAVHHSVTSIQALQVKLSKRRKDHVGENVARGRSMAQMHLDIISTTAMTVMPCGGSAAPLSLHYYESHLRDNILSSVFHQVGMGMARGKDGYLYLCQLFQ